MLDLSKSETGKMILDVQDVDMREILKDCATMVREQAAEAGLEFAIRGVGTETAAEGRSRQAAPDFPQSAFQRDQIHAASGGHVWVEARSSAAGIAVTVGDSGIGMSPEDLAVALQPFGQVDNRLERRYEGTGLGLPLTKAFIELHGGRLSFDSARGAGTRVTVTFPAAIEIALAEAG